MHPLIQANLSKINFELGRNPSAEKTDQFRKYIPEPYRAVFTLSADFELAWAWRFSKQLADPVQDAREKARLARHNVPLILQYCEQYQIPITWATVGHLFLSDCQCVGGQAHADMERLGHFENDYWKFDQGDWYKDDPCTDYQTDPEWYCPDLIEAIRASPVGHEIGCHTFSHIDCRDAVCPPEVFRAELQKCRQLAEAQDIRLNTFIYPAHTVGNLEVLPQAGFTNYRTNIGNVLGYPVRHRNGLWEIKSSMQLELRPQWSLDYHVYRARKTIDRAIKHRSVCHFWFHPSFPTNYLREVFSEVLAYLHSRRADLHITTMEHYVAWLNNRDNAP